MSDFEYFKPYEGDKPYIFISYAHADDDAVLPIVSDMHRRGYNIWYDEGIEVGSEWQECIASHLADAHLVVAFISNAYMRSDNCRREMHYAQSKKIKTINIFVEETALTPGMELQIGNIFALMKYTYPSDEYFYDKLYSAPLLNSENFADASPRPTTETAKSVPVLPKKEEKEKKKPGKGRKIARWSIAVAVFGVLLAALIVGYFTGYLEKLLTPTTQIETLAADTVCDFKNAVFESAAREYTGKDRRNAELCVKKARAQTREHADNYGNQQRCPRRHPGKQEHYRDRAAGCERTVNGHIGYIQQSEGYEHAQRHESPYYALRNGSRHS